MIGEVMMSWFQLMLHYVLMSWIFFQGLNSNLPYFLYNFLLHVLGVILFLIHFRGLVCLKEMLKCCCVL